MMKKGSQSISTKVKGSVGRPVNASNQLNSSCDLELSAETGFHWSMAGGSREFLLFAPAYVIQSQKGSGLSDYQERRNK
jgi:hypothetical protein